MSLREIDAPSTIPEDFDLKEYFGDAWAVFRGDESYDVELLFSADAADIVPETIWHHTQTVARHKDGTATFTFTVDGLTEIVRWVVGWAGRVKVIKPRELLDLVLERHERAIEVNEK